MKNKGRWGDLNGEKAGKSCKLTWPIVKEIRKIYTEGILNQYKIATLFGIDQSRVSVIINNKSWKKK